MVEVHQPQIVQPDPEERNGPLEIDANEVVKVEIN